MMNPEGGKVSMAHDHGAMTGDKKPESGSEHAGHETGKEQPMQMDMTVDKNFQKQLTAVYKAQLNLQEAFLATNPQEVKSAVPGVESSLKKVDMSLVKGEMHNHWMTSLKALNDALSKIQAAGDIEAQRLAYADFNDTLYGAIKMFGVTGETIYFQFCPMARSGKGAYWLSAIKEIKNPYYGEAMLTCGETKEVIK
jgi:Cu(I)/Ag(I) efflux system membrane fusion protein